MYYKLVQKLKHEQAVYTRTRNQYPEIARQAKVNIKAIEKQMQIAVR